MSIDNNNGLFDKIKKTMDTNHIKALMGQKINLSPEQQVQLRDLFKTENDKYKQALKEKYQGIAKSVVQKREQELLEKFKQELSRIKAQEGNNVDLSQKQQKILAATWHSQVNALQQELDQQKALVQSSIDQGLQAGREIGFKQAEEKYSHIMSQRSNEFRDEFTKLNDKEQELKNRFQEEFRKQEELLTIQNNARIKSELARELQKHNLELDQVKAESNARIVALETQLANMNPEIEFNIRRMRSEIEAELQASYAVKFEAYKNDLIRSKSDEVQAALIVEKQKLAMEFEQENVVVLRYKERDLKDQYDTQLVQTRAQIKLELEQEFREQLAQQEKRLLAEAQLQIEQERAKHQSELQIKLQEAATQERVRIGSQHTNENRILLQQQHDSLVAKHEADLAVKLAELSSKLTREHKKEIEAVESEKEQAVIKAMAARERELKFQYNLDDIDEHKANLENEKREELAKFEKELRMEFQDLLVQQRKLAAQKYATQKAYDIQKALAKYRDEIEDELKKEYADKWVQHTAKIKAELNQDMEQELSIAQKDLAKQKLIAMKEQEQKLEQKMQQKLHDAIEQERKKLGIKFAQDKATLIKDLGAKFNQEKQIAIEEYENDLRESLYKEMVRQKDHIQTKFSKGQEAALLEQKRRLEAEHKQELERIKQGYFDKKDANDFSQAVINTRMRHNPVAVERGVEQLADRILAKFQTTNDKH